MDISLTIAIIGISNSGKTSIVHSLLNRKQEIFPTAGIDINYILIGNKQMLVYDCSGEGRSRQNWKLFCNLADSVAFVIDGHDSDRFLVSKKVLTKFLETNKFMKKKNLCIMINKSDMKNRPPKQLIFKALEIDKMQKLVNKIYVRQSSAFNKDGLQQCFAWMFESSLLN